MAEPTNSTKRRVKNPETFRERAEKANQASENASRKGWIRTTIQKVLGPVFRPLKQAIGKLLQVQPFKAISYVIVPPYVRHSWKELRLVTWPTFRESYKLTFAVLVFAIIFGVAIAAVDYGLDRLFRDILLNVNS